LILFEESFKKCWIISLCGEYLNSELSLDDMWEKIEGYGMDRKILESTNPSNELLFQLYVAITKVNEKVLELEQ
jgi:hypothetical protein